MINSELNIACRTQAWWAGYQIGHGHDTACNLADLDDLYLMSAEQDEPDHEGSDLWRDEPFTDFDRWALASCGITLDVTVIHLPGIEESYEYRMVELALAEVHDSPFNKAMRAAAKNPGSTFETLFRNLSTIRQ